MTAIKTTTKIVSVLGVAGLALSLAACSGIQSVTGGGQSVEEACDIANSTVNEANTDMEALFSEAMSGEGNMSDLFAPISQALEDAQKKVTNSEVADSLKSINADFSEMGGLLGDFQIPNLEDLDMTDPSSMEQLEDFQAQAEAISEQLEASAEKLEESGEKLQELCGA